MSSIIPAAIVGFVALATVGTIFKSNAALPSQAGTVAIKTRDSASNARALAASSYAAQDSTDSSERVPITQLFTAPDYPSQDSTSPKDHARTLFAEKCSRCHGNDGRSQTVIGKMLGAPDFTSEKWWTKEITDDRLTKSITTGKEEMPAFGKKLNPEEVQSLIDYIRQFNPRKEQ